MTLRFANSASAFGLLFSLYATLTPIANGDDSSFVQRIIDRFGESDIVFGTSLSNAPYPPVGTFALSSYEGVKLTNFKTANTEKVDITKITQGAYFPILLDKSNALLFGEYLSWSEFEPESPSSSSFDVSSISIPIAWLRQGDVDSQQAAFLMPTAHHSSLADGTWSWQLQGGVFARKIQSEKLWWAYGMFVDFNPNADYFLPYLGASWALTPEWTISAIMPWPAISYTPTEDWLFRLGAAPSGASWNVDQSDGEVAVNFSTWDLGLSAERRLKGYIWASVETGISGLGSFVLNSDGDFESPETNVDSSWYLRFAIRLRPTKNLR